jgi:ribosomal-protein-alanine N-acetyltransferase
MNESEPQSRPAMPLISISTECPLDLNAVKIATGRLTLRPVTAEFTELIFAEFTPEITKYMLPSSPRHISETEQFIADTLEKRSRGSDLVLAILAKETEEFLGCCGLHGRENPREPELGIWLKKSAHGRGFGREAVAAVRDWAARHLIVDAFIYPVDRNNTASRKVAEALGGTIIRSEPVKTMSGGELDAVIYKIPAGEPEAESERDHFETQRPRRSRRIT